MEPATIRKHVGEARVARLATVGANGKPHLVPITFAVEGDTVYFAVDAKPKRTTDLQRLKNIEANPAVCLLVDHYDEDWSKLWWVRIDGTARVIDEPKAAAHAVELLAARHPQYRHEKPAGPVVAISIDRITAWSAA